jgi:hypothetical protein
MLTTRTFMVTVKVEVEAGTMAEAVALLSDAIVAAERGKTMPAGRSFELVGVEAARKARTQ